MTSLGKRALNGEPRAAKEFLKQCEIAGMLTPQQLEQTHGVFAAPRGVDPRVAKVMIETYGLPPWERDEYAAVEAELERDRGSISKNYTRNFWRIWTMDDALKPRPGRKPPPAEHQFLKGTSGNKRGRPKGSVDLKKLTRKVAQKKHAVKVDGKIVRKTLLQLVVESMVRQAATGAPSMVALFAEIRAKVSPTQDKLEGGFLLAPADCRGKSSSRKKKLETPTRKIRRTYVNHKAEEMCKAARGIDSPLGEALLAFHRRWG